MRKSYRWQSECLQKWIDSGYRGIIEVVTGGGKTYFANLAVNEILKRNEKTTILVVVPKIALLAQWKESLEENGFNQYDIGVKYGAYKSSNSKKVIIYVLNTARYILSRDLIEIQGKGNDVFLIVDEYHHLASRENNLTFDFFNSQSFDQSKYYSLGLTATASTINLEERIIPFLGPFIYSYPIQKALEESIVAKYTLFNVRIRLNVIERDDYEDKTRQIITITEQLKSKYPTIMNQHWLDLKTKLNKIKAINPNDDLVDALNILLYMRRNIIIESRARLKAAMEIIKEREDAKVLIFTERIWQCDSLFHQIHEQRGGVVRYHSKMDEQEKETAITRFKYDEARILVCCKALDEGINVPKADVGIFIANTSSERQRIQRVGRLLRKTEDKEMADLYYIYASETIESSSMLDIDSNLVNVVNLEFENESINNREYVRLFRYLLGSRLEQLTDAQMKKLYTIAQRGLLRHDYLLDEEVLKDKFERSNDEYFLIMLQLNRISKQMSMSNDEY